MRESEAAKLSPESLLKGYPINAAIQMRIDDKVGSLTVGTDANFNIFDSKLGKWTGKTTILVLHGYL